MNLTVSPRAEDSIFDRARRIAQTASGARPELLWSRLAVFGSIGGLGIVGIVITLLVIGSGLPESEPARIVALGILVTACTLVLLAMFASGITVCRAFLYQYVRRLEAEDDRAATDRQLEGGWLAYRALLAWRGEEVRLYLEEQAGKHSQVKAFLELCDDRDRS